MARRPPAMLAFTQMGLCLLCPLNRAARDESVAVGTLAGGSWRGAGHPAMDRAPSQAPRPSPLHGLARPACRPCLVLQGPAQGRKLSVPGLRTPWCCGGDPDESVWPAGSSVQEGPPDPAAGLPAAPASLVVLRMASRFCTKMSQEVPRSHKSQRARA